MDRSDLHALRSFESEVRQLLAGYKKQQEELRSLHLLLSSKEEEIGQLQSSLRSYERAYSNLTTARMLEVSDGDIRSAKLRITRLVREVNKCIRLLSAEMCDIGDSQEAGDDSSKNAENPSEPSDNKAETTEKVMVPSNDELESAEDDAASLHKETDSAEEVEISPSDEEETNQSDDISESPDDVQESPEEGLESPSGETKPSDDVSAPMSDQPNSEPLQLEIKNDSQSVSKEPDLWADFGMLPLFSDDEPKQ